MKNYYGDIIVKAEIRLRVDLTMDESNYNPKDILEKLKRFDINDITDDEILNYLEVVDISDLDAED